MNFTFAFKKTSLALVLLIFSPAIAFSNQGTDKLDCRNCHRTNIELREKFRQMKHGWILDEDISPEELEERVWNILYGEDDGQGNKNRGLARVVFKLWEVEKKIRAINIDKQEELENSEESIRDAFVPSQTDLAKNSKDVELNNKIFEAQKRITQRWQPKIDKTSKPKIDLLKKYPILKIIVWKDDPSIGDLLIDLFADTKPDKDFLYIHLYKHLDAIGYRPDNPENETSFDYNRVDSNTPVDMTITGLLSRAFKELDEKLYKPAPIDPRDMDMFNQPVK